MGMAKVTLAKVLEPDYCATTRPKHKHRRHTAYLTNRKFTVGYSILILDYSDGQIPGYGYGLIT